MSTTTENGNGSGPCEGPVPEKEHEWLQQFAGEWDSETEIFMEPGAPPMKFKGSELARMLGDFWLVSEASNEMPGNPYTSRLTLGYCPGKKKYIGSWIDSMSSTFWLYEGDVDATGKALTLYSEGRCPGEPDKLSKVKEVTEFKSPDHRVSTSYAMEGDGKWTACVVVNYYRKK